MWELGSVGTPIILNMWAFGYGYIYIYIYLYRNEGFLSGIFHSCALWARAVARWDSRRRVAAAAVGVSLSQCPNVPIFPGSMPNQNEGIFKIPKFNTKSKWWDLQYSQIQYQITMIGFTTLPNSIPNQNDGIFNISMFSTKSKWWDFQYSQVRTK